MKARFHPTIILVALKVASFEPRGERATQTAIFLPDSCLSARFHLQRGWHPVFFDLTAASKLLRKQISGAGWARDAGLLVPPGCGSSSLIKAPLSRDPTYLRMMWLRLTCAWEPLAPRAV